MSDFAEHALPVAISPGGENVKEVLAFFHHQISQLSKDVAILNKRVAELASARDSAPLSGMIELNSKRIDDISLSLQTATDQMAQRDSLIKESIANLSTTIHSEFSDKLLDMGIKLKEVYHKADNARLLSTSLEARVTDVEAKSLQSEKELLQLRNEISELKKQGLPPAVLTPIEPRAVSRKASTSPRPKLNATLNHVEIFTCRPAPDIVNRIDAAKAALGDLKSTQELVDRVNEYDQKFTEITERLDEFATKSDLYAIVQGFIASGADGVVESAARAHLTRPGQHRHLIIDGKPPQRQRSAHVKVLSGETPKRPFTTQPPK